MSEYIGVFVCEEEQRERIDRTTLLHGFIRPVLAVFYIVTDFAAVNTLPVLTAELSWPVALCNCWEDKTHYKVRDQLFKKTLVGAINMQAIL